MTIRRCVVCYVQAGIARAEAQPSGPPLLGQEDRSAYERGYFRGLLQQVCSPDYDWKHCAMHSRERTAARRQERAELEAQIAREIARERAEPE